MLLQIIKQIGRIKISSDKVDVKWTLRCFQKTLRSVDVPVVTGSVRLAFLGRPNRT